MADRKTAGQGLSDRLSARADGGVSARRMADGGQVYSGSLARQALRSVGARAMTVEGGDIVVDEGFDPSKPHDAALYAHERLHQQASGGSGGGAAGHNDAEEQGARAIEAMVHHRMEAGEDLADVLRDVTLSRATELARSSGDAPGESAVSHLVQRALDSGANVDDPMNAYWMARAKGKPHAEVVDDLARWVTQQLEQRDQERRYRTAE